MSVKIMMGQGDTRVTKSQALEAIASTQYKGVVVATRDRDLADELTLAANEAFKPIVIWGTTVSDTETFKAIAVQYSPDHGYSLMIEESLMRAEQRFQPVFPLFLQGSRDLTGQPDSRIEILRSQMTRNRDISQPVVITAQDDDEQTTMILKEALIKHKTVNYILLSSDYIELLKPLLTSSGMSLPSEHPVHPVIICFDGDAKALEYLEQGFVDMVGGRDLQGECDAALQNLDKAVRGNMRLPEAGTTVPGRVVTIDNLDESDKKVWIKDYQPPKPEEESKRTRPSDK